MPPCLLFENALFSMRNINRTGTTKRRTNKSKNAVLGAPFSKAVGALGSLGMPRAKGSPKTLIRTTLAQVDVLIAGRAIEKEKSRNVEHCTFRFFEFTVHF